MSTEKNNFYGSDSISALKGADPYREKPATVLGTDDIRGAIHAVMEVLDNAADEAREGHSDKVIFKAWKDGSVEIQDFGRGVPMGWNSKEQKYAYELIFCTMYASGKYDASNYTKSAGLNGVGDTAAQFTSEYMEVESIRDEQINVRTKADGSVDFDLERTRYTIRFEKGYPVTKLKIEKGVKEHTGTRIKFKPDIEVFKHATTVIVPIETYMDKIRRKAMLLKGVRFEVHYEGADPVSICFENGSSEYIDMVCEKRFSKKMINLEGSDIGRDDEANLSEPYKAWYDICFSFSRENNFVEVYHNGSELTLGGSSLDGFKNAIVKALTDIGRDLGKVGKTERIQLKDVEDLLVAVVSTDCPGFMTSYMNQTKVAITNRFIQKLVEERTYIALKEWSAKNKNDIDRIVQEVLLNKQAREKADAVKKSVIRELSKGIDGFKNAPNKLVRCTSKNPRECELYIVEGDSAKGPTVLARDSKTQAILPLRGKTINCMKESLERILSSDIIRNIIQCLGCGIELQSKHLRDLPKFDINKLNYDKIIICTDADDDGFHIRTLVITMIYRLMPSLLKAGKVYIVETPLFMYTIVSGKQKSYRYAYSKSEGDAIMKELLDSGVKKSNIIVKRMKGLGEADASVMNETTMDKQNRHLIKLQYSEDDTEFGVLLSSLMGSDVASRRSLIEAYFDDDFGDIDYEEDSNLALDSAYRFY